MPVVTFTNRAAREMKERVENMLATSQLPYGSEPSTAFASKFCAATPNWSAFSQISPFWEKMTKNALSNRFSKLMLSIRKNTRLRQFLIKSAAGRTKASASTRLTPITRKTSQPRSTNFIRPACSNSTASISATSSYMP